MHFEILVEDRSGEEFLDHILPKIIIHPHTFKIHSYKGIGHIPKNLNHDSDPSKRMLLQRLPKILQGYGRTYSTSEYKPVIIIICDLDKRCRHEFRNELLNVLDKCNPKPQALFCITVEEGESWLLGDLDAIRKAYPNAKNNILNRYQNDSICNTWECLADAVGAEKSKWAQQICPHMDINNNKSPSFNYLKRKITDLLGSVVN